MEKGCAAFMDLIEVDTRLLESALEVRGVFTFDGFIRGYWSFCFFEGDCYLVSSLFYWG